MWFASSQKISDAPKLSLKIGYQSLQDVNTYKYLGVTLDSKLTLASFADDINRKIVNKVFKLANYRYMMDEHTAIAVYRQTILPFADYCSFILDSAKKKTTIERIQLLQNQALRMCLKCKMREETVADLHLRCEIPFLEDRRKELLASLMYRKSRKIKSVHSDVNTRSADRFNFYLKRPRSGFYINSPYYRGVTIWNSLSEATQLQDKKVSFKLRLKRECGTYMKGKRKAYKNSREFINRQRRNRARHDILVNA